MTPEERAAAVEYALVGDWWHRVDHSPDLPALGGGYTWTFCGEMFRVWLRKANLQDCPRCMAEWVRQGCPGGMFR